MTQPVMVFTEDVLLRHEAPPLIRLAQRFACCARNNAKSMHTSWHTRHLGAITGNREAPPSLGQTQADKRNIPAVLRPRG